MIPEFPELSETEEHARRRAALSFGTGLNSPTANKVARTAKNIHQQKWNEQQNRRKRGEPPMPLPKSHEFQSNYALVIDKEIDRAIEDEQDFELEAFYNGGESYIPIDEKRVYLWFVGRTLRYLKQKNWHFSLSVIFFYWLGLEIKYIKELDEKYLSNLTYSDDTPNDLEDYRDKRRKYRGSVLPEKNKNGPDGLSPGSFIETKEIDGEHRFEPAADSYLEWEELKSFLEAQLPLFPKCCPLEWFSAKLDPLSDRIQEDADELASKYVKSNLVSTDLKAASIGAIQRRLVHLMTCSICLNWTLLLLAREDESFATRLKQSLKDSDLYARLTQYVQEKSNGFAIKPGSERSHQTETIALMKSIDLLKVLWVHPKVNLSGFGPRTSTGSGRLRPMQQSMSKEEKTSVDSSRQAAEPSVPNPDGDPSSSYDQDFEEYAKRLKEFNSSEIWLTYGRYGREKTEDLRDHLAGEPKVFSLEPTDDVIKVWGRDSQGDLELDTHFPSWSPQLQGEQRGIEKFSTCLLNGVLHFTIEYTGDDLEEPAGARVEVMCEMDSVSAGANDPVSLEAQAEEGRSAQKARVMVAKVGGAILGLLLLALVSMWFISSQRSFTKSSEDQKEGRQALYSPKAIEEAAHHADMVVGHDLNRSSNTQASFHPSKGSDAQYIIRKGQKIGTLLLQPINPADLTAGRDVTVVVSHAVSSNGDTVIPQGSRITGKVRPAGATESSLMIDFQSLVLPNGDKLLIGAKYEDEPAIDRAANQVAQNPRRVRTRPTVAMRPRRNTRSSCAPNGGVRPAVPVVSGEDDRKKSDNKRMEITLTRDLALPAQQTPLAATSTP